ncbi:BAG family molecular chaperone regulator 4-like isoform X1 [Gossypium arboreum]|nr:BAG family molecular chaperone regulator 4-like isoform X1 [Gossypium arboreum]
MEFSKDTLDALARSNKILSYIKMKNPNAKSEESDWEVRPGGMLVQLRDHRKEEEEDDDDHTHHNHNHETAAASSGGPMINSDPAHSPAQLSAQSYFDNTASKEKMTNTKDNKVEEVKESEEISKAFAAVAGVRKEVDKLSERVAALEVAVNSGTKVTDEEFVVPAELLMRELLKLDGIEAEGEARLQRKAEVRRIQKYHEIQLKTRNSNPFSDKHKAVSVTTNWETFDSGMGSLTAPPPMSSSTNTTQDWERFD